MKTNPMTETKPKPIETAPMPREGPDLIPITMLEVFLVFDDDKKNCTITILRHNTPEYRRCFYTETTWDEELDSFILPEYKKFAKITGEEEFARVSKTIHVRFWEKFQEAYDAKPPEKDPDANSSSSQKEQTEFDRTSVENQVMCVNELISLYNVFVDTVFFRDGNLCEVRPDEQNNTVVCEITPQRLAYILSTVTEWVKRVVTKDGVDEFVSCAGPTNEELKRVIAAGVNYKAHTGLWKAPPLKTVASSVLVTLDGDIIAKRGYYKDLQIFLAKDFDVPEVPLHPTAEDIAKAKAILFEPLKEFQFAREDEAEKELPVAELVNFQNAVLAVFLAFLRPVIPGPFPILLVNKSSRGIGGTVLPDTISRLACGEPAHITPASSQEEANNKEYAAMLLEKCRIGVLDNVEPGAKWATETLLSATSGSGKISVRKFRTQETIKTDVVTFFIVNGVNISNFDDAVRRILLIRLSAPVSYSELHYARTREELQKFAEESHPMLAWAFAVLIRHWKDEGSPKFALSGIANEYRELYGFACGVLKAAGYSHLLENLEPRLLEENEVDTEFSEMMSVLFGWAEKEAFTPKKLTEKLLELGACRREGKFGERLLDAFPEKIVDSAAKGTLTSRQVSRVLGEFVDKKVKGCSLTLKKSRPHKPGEETTYAVAPLQQQSVLAGQ